MFQQGMKNKISIYVPSTHHSVPLSVADQQKYVGLTESFMARRFGGATTIRARGAWVYADGSIATEEMHLVYSFTSVITAEDQQAVETFVQDLKAQLAQEAVSVEINNELHFL
jgi:hypothetical protein